MQIWLASPVTSSRHPTKLQWDSRLSRWRPGCPISTRGGLLRRSGVWSRCRQSRRGMDHRQRVGPTPPTRQTVSYSLITRDSKLGASRFLLQWSNNISKTSAKPRYSFPKTTTSAPIHPSKTDSVCCPPTTWTDSKEALSREDSMRDEIWFKLSFTISKWKSKRGGWILKRINWG